MGSIITLGIGQLEIDWGKNLSYRDHGALFQPEDIKQIPRYYHDDDGDNVLEEPHQGVSRKLKFIKRRLELLGYSKGRLKSLFEEHLKLIPDYYAEIRLTYEEFHEVVFSLDVSKITPDDQWADYDAGEFLSRYLLKHPEFNKIHNLSEIIDKDIGLVFEHLDPYITLRILAENPINKELDVYWSYQDLIDGGWIEEEDILRTLGASHQILIVTEGSSDTKILRKAFDILYPDIADFFTFVDMQENYPFTGAGNLSNFCKGLASIQIQNNVLVIFDNDVAGAATLNRLCDVKLPENMHIIKLPEHESFEHFETVGPNGKSKESINGTAVAIECFLDHSYLSNDAPIVRWQSYDKTLDAYQGELVCKKKYMINFLKLKTEDLGDYDLLKLKHLLDYLYKEWIINIEYD